MAELRVLIVDDSEDHRTLLKLKMRESVCRAVAEAGNGEEALSVLAQTEVDVVLLDTKMPVMDGIEATKRIKTEFPDQRVVAMSATGDLRDTKPMMDAGAECCYDKNNLDELIDALCGRE